MNNGQITALAREYAEIECPEFKYKGDKEWRNDDIKSATLGNGAFLTWLLRRYALVEKENIKKYFQSRNYILTHQDKYEVYIVRESEVEMKLLRCLFLEIAKEVEE